MKRPVRAAVPVSMPRRAAGAALAALLLAGCGTGADAGRPVDSPAAEAVARAAEKAEAVTSVRYRVTGRMPQRGKIADEGAAREEPAAGLLKTVNLGGEERGETELRLVGGVLYASAPDDMVEEMGGRHWISYGPATELTTAGGLRMDVAGLRDQVSRNPAREAAFLAAAEDVERIGAETVGGTGTTHYSGTVTVDELRASLDDVADKAVRQGQANSLRQYEKQGVDELTLDVWVDGDDRVKQLRTQGFGRHGELDLTCTFLDQGNPVTVRAPRAADTADVRKPLEKNRG